MNQLQRIYFLLAFFYCGFATHLPVHAQIKQYNFRHLTPDDGLTQSIISDIYTDSKGYVWMSGLDGVNRFDGSHCLANSQIAPGIDGPVITRKIMEDQEGNIWFGSSDGIISYSYKTNQFTHFKIKGDRNIQNSGDLNSGYNPVFVDQQGNMILNYHSEELLLYNIKTKRTVYFKSPVPFSIRYGVFIPKGTTSLEKGWKWIMSSSDTLFIFVLSAMPNGIPQWEKKIYLFKNLLYSPNVWMPDENTIFMYADDRIVKYRLSSAELINSDVKPLSGTSITFSPDPNGHLWVSAASDGIYELDTATMKAISKIQYDKQDKNGISGSDMQSVIDRNQMLWVMAWGKGVDYTSLTENRFSSFLSGENAKEGGYSNFIRSITEVPGEGFYCGTESGIIVLDENLRFKRKLTGKEYEYHCPGIYFENGSVYYIFDRNSKTQLYEYKLNSRVMKKYLLYEGNRLIGVHPYYIGKTNTNDLLIANFWGLVKFNLSTKKIEAVPGIPIYDAKVSIVYVYEDKQQQIYSCYNTAGFSVYRKQGGVYKKVFFNDDGLTVKHILPENDSLLWICTSGGLYLFNTVQLKIVRKYTTGDGLPNNVIYAAVMDDSRNLWLSTNKGLSYFNRINNTFTNFSKEDGLQANEFNTHVAIRASDGRIIFGGVNGLTVVNPNVLGEKLPFPMLQITALKTDTVLNPHIFNNDEAELILEPGTSSFELELTGINFSNPALCKIKYRLQGIDQDWEMVGNPGNIRYTKLPAGVYTLEAMVSNVRGEFGTEMKRLKVTVKAYWWQTAWFKTSVIVLAVLLAIMGVLLFLRVKLNQQKRKLEKQLAIQKERERITADLHDDVGATLSSMYIYGELASSVWEIKPAESKEMVSRISVQSKELMNRMSDIIWSLKSPLEEKNSFTVRLKNYTQELLAGKGISSTFNIDELLTSQIVNPLARKNILLIAKEAINNIAKYSGATMATISISRSGDDLELLVSDNGHGFDKSRITSGNGLGNMEQRCNQLHGTCQIETSPGSGVRITCRIPVAIFSHTA